MYFDTEQLGSRNFFCLILIQKKADLNDMTAVNDSRAANEHANDEYDIPQDGEGP